MGSVWNEEIDIALIKLIKETVKYHDENDNVVTPDVLVRNPQGEFKIKTFPSVSIFNFNQEFANYRYDDKPVIKEILDTGEVIMEQSALPYDLHYQIDFWSKYHVDMNEMTKSWMGNVRPRTVLEVIDTEGTTRHSNMSLYNFANVEEPEDGMKVFHKAYSYKIWVELDESNEYRTRVVTEVDIEEVDMP